MAGEQQEQGQLRLAPESFLAPDLVNDIQRNGVDDSRRKLLRGAFAAASAALVAPTLRASDDPDIVNVPSGAAVWVSQWPQTPMVCHRPTNLTLCAGKARV